MEEVIVPLPGVTGLEGPRLGDAPVTPLLNLRPWVPQIPEIPSEGRFGCIVADPPWRFVNKSSNGAAGDHYDTLTVEQLCAIPVRVWAADQAHLYLWTTDTHLLDGTAMRVAEAWGFAPKQIVTWVKANEGRVQMGTGNYYRHCTEHVIFATRGRTPARVKNLLALVVAPRGEHSGKPERLQDLAEYLSPGPYLELFARRARPGWICMGDGAAVSEPLVDIPDPTPVVLDEEIEAMERINAMAAAQMHRAPAPEPEPEPASEPEPAWQGDLDAGRFLEDRFLEDR